MTIRAYEPTYTPLNMSDEVKRKKLVLERRDIDRVLISEDLKTVFLYKDNVKEPEAFIHSDYRLEILKGEPDDGVSDGLTSVASYTADRVVIDSELGWYCTAHWLDCLYHDFLEQKTAGEQIPCQTCKKHEDCKSCPPVNFLPLMKKSGVRVSSQSIKIK